MSLMFATKPTQKESVKWAANKFNQYIRKQCWARGYFLDTLILFICTLSGTKNQDYVLSST